MQLQGILAWLAYNFSRHRIANVPLTWWVAAFLVAWSALMALGSVPTTPTAVAAAALALALLVAIGLGARNSYVVFRADPSPSVSPAAPLTPELKVPARATGFFEVSGMRKYFAHVQAWFETVETREHIVIARNPRSRFLLLATTKEQESGMWYAFFQPLHIRSMETGTACFGARTRPALRIAFLPEDRKDQEILYLTFESQKALDLVLNDLRLDAAI